MKATFATLLVVLAASSVAAADTVQVTISGNVLFNGINNPPLNAVGANADVEMSFSVDSNNFVDGFPGDTRGYVIDQSSFALTFSTPVSVGLLNPFPAGETPYFTLVEGFPVADGFWVSTSPMSPGGVPISQTPLQANFAVSYAGSTLNSLNILDALGTYTFTGLSSFSYTLWQVFPDNAVMEIDFKEMIIAPEPATMVLASLGLLLLRRRR